MDYPNKVNYFYMDCMTWIQESPQDSMINTLNTIYEHKMVYRTVIVCRNAYTLNHMYYQLCREGLSTIRLQSIWQLKNFSTSNYRIMLIQFNQIYHYPELFKIYAIEEGYLWILHELNSLQEQCCLHHIKSILDKNFYIYVD